MISRPSTMSNYHVEPADRPQALDAAGDQVAPPSPGPGDLAAAAPALLDRRRDRACGCSRSPPARSASSGRTCPAASAARSRSARSTTSSSRTANLPIAEGFPAYFPEARAYIVLIDPGRQQFVAGRRTRPATARPSTSAASTSAARTSAASRTRASRTSGSSARATGRATTGSGSRPPAPQYGPAPRSMDRFSATRRRRRRPDPRHRQDHARAAAGRARPAGHHPAADADRLHLMTDETPTTPAPVADGPRSGAPGAGAEERLPATRPAGAASRPSGSRPRRRSRPSPG